LLIAAICSGSLGKYPVVLFAPPLTAKLTKTQAAIVAAAAAIRIRFLPRPRFRA
jgi:hypothetical protein